MKVLISHEEIVGICKRIAGTITERFRDSEPIVVCVLKGSGPFHAELIKHLDFPLYVDYLQVKSYEGTESTGKLLFKKDLDFNIKGRDVIIVEDIVDTGLTLSQLKPILMSRDPKSLTFVTLLDKPSRRKVEFQADIVGKTIDNLFVIGFGLDLDEKYRNLKDVCIYEE